MNIPVPPVSGWSMTLEVAAQEFAPSPVNCLTGNFSSAMSLGPFDVAFTPSQSNSQVWLYVELFMTQQNTIEQNVGEVITVPPNVIVPGRKFYMDSYYYFGPWTPMQGPLTVQGNTLSAGPSGNDAFQVGPAPPPMEMVLYSVGP